MQGPKPEVKKLVSLKNLLLGMENIYNPDLGTNVKVSCDTKCLINGQQAWLRSLMPTWIKQLNFYSGGRVTSWSFEKDKRGYNGAQINLEMFFEGAINKNKLHPKTAAMLSGQIRKLIAMQVLEAYPPPFDVREPLFAAGVADLIKIELGTSMRDSEIKNFTTGIQNEAIIKEVRACFEKVDAEFVKFFRNKKGFLEYDILFKWKRDITKEERCSGIDGVRKFLHNQFGVHPSLHK